jgi:glucan-binding YG repeat protein
MVIGADGNPYIVYSDYGNSQKATVMKLEEDKEVTSVDSLTDKTVSNGTNKSDIGLPETIDVTLSNGTTTSAAVTWNNGSPAYDGNTARTYTFTGTLTLPDGVANPNNYTASVNVIVQAANNVTTPSAVTVEGVNSLDDKTVANGTNKSDIGLPDTIDVTLSNSTTTSVAVRWNNGSPTYNGDVSGTYTFTGTLILPDGVTNPNNYTVSVKVIVQAGNNEITPAAVRIEGTTRVGETLTAQLKDGAGNNYTTSAAVTYEWYRLDNSNSEYVNVIGTDETYKLTNSDLGKYIGLIATYDEKSFEPKKTARIIEASNNSSSTSSSNSSSTSSSSSSNTSSSSSSNTSSSSSSKSSSANDQTTATNNKTATTSEGWNENSKELKYIKNGQPITGWNQIGGSWYLMDSTGVVQKGWQQTNGTWYLLKNDGTMATGWQQTNGTWYLLKNDGAMATGWQETNGEWYYLYSYGAMASNTIIDGYRLNENGAWVK